MGARVETLRQAMVETGMSQSRLARLSGVRQPSISQFLANKVDFSDEQLERLLFCMGYRLEVTRRALLVELTRSELRSWKLHRQLATHLTPSTLAEWRSTILANVARLCGSVRGQPHIRNLRRWEDLAVTADVAGIRRALTGLDRDSIEMREVSAMGGLLPDSERQEALQGDR